MPIDHENLIQERNAQYGEAYRETDRWIKANLGLLASSPSPFSLIMIQNKLTRALASPLKADHYDDIIGYAKLILREVERAQADVLPTDWVAQDEDGPDWVAPIISPQPDYERVK